MRRLTMGRIVGCALPVLVLLCLSVPAQAQVNAGVLFLRIAAGARAAGMGEAFVALANDATATHWNPAGLGVAPLHSDWHEIPLPAYGTVWDAVTVMHQLSPSAGMVDELWILTDQGLLLIGPGNIENDYPARKRDSGMVVRGRAANFMSLGTGGMRSVEAVVRRYAPFLSEADAEAIARRAAASTVGISPDDLNALVERISASFPSDYKDRTIMDNVLRELRVAHREGRIQLSGYAKLKREVAAIPEGAAADILHLDRLRVAAERSVSRQLPRRIVVRFADIAHAPIRAIAGDGDHLYVAAANGLLTYDGSRWEAVDPPDGVDWTTTQINCLEIATGRRLWVGTDAGVFTRQSNQWTRLGTEMGLPPGPVRMMAVAGPKTAWVLTDGALSHYDGTAFYPAASVTANVGDSLATLVARFIGTEDERYAGWAAETVRAENNLPSGFVPEAGKDVRVPQILGIRGRVTAMEFDSFGRLWVGTELGTFRHSKGRWRAYGYRAVAVTEATTVTDLARKRLGTRATPERVEYLVARIKSYNRLDGESVPAGSTVYIYRNAAGAQVNAFETHGDRLLVATEIGQLEVNSGTWDRYELAGLGSDRVRALGTTERDVWFVTDGRVVVYQSARKEIHFQHAPWLPQFGLDLYYEFLTYVTNVEGIGTLGLAFTFLSFGEIERRDEFGTLLDKFNSFDGALSLSYGARLTPNLAGGFTAKIVFSRLADAGAGTELGSGSATAFALDAGVLYRTPWRRLTLGAALTNIGPDITYIDAQQSDALPRNLAIGFAYDLWDSPFNTLKVVGEINKELIDLTEGGSRELRTIVINGGAEYWYSNVLALRVGTIVDQAFRDSKDNWIPVGTAGLGLALKAIQMDVGYLFSDSELPLANTLRFSLSAKF